MVTISFTLTGMFLLSGCASIGAFVIAKNATCNVIINDKCVKGSCDLINGVFFERLTVIKKDSNGMPSEYRVTERFACYNPGITGVQEYWPNKIYFNKINGHYKWNADTVDISFKSDGNNREIISIQKKPDNYNEWFILNSKIYDTCSFRFQKETWYNVKISDPRLRQIYLYIDEKGNFNVHKFDGGIGPI